MLACSSTHPIPILPIELCHMILHLPSPLLILKRIHTLMNELVSHAQNGKPE